MPTKKPIKKHEIILLENMLILQGSQIEQGVQEEIIKRMAEAELARKGSTPPLQSIDIAGDNSGIVANGNISTDRLMFVRHYHGPHKDKDQP